jgi:hypothetical protein
MKKLLSDVRHLDILHSLVLHSSILLHWAVRVGTVHRQPIETL